MAITGSTSYRSTAEALATGDGPILLYDGTCGFCARSVQFVLNRERRRRDLRFARLDGSLGLALRARRPELATIDSLIWYEPATSATPERLLWQSRGALRVARYLGGFWGLLGSLGVVIPRVMADAAYGWIARHRHELAAASCIVPTQEQRARFLD